MRRPDDRPAESGSVRVDVWLWRARVVKTRALAATLVRAGHVRLNGRRIAAPGRIVRAGDVVVAALERTVRVLRVLEAGERRGPAAEARALFEDLGEAAPAPSAHPAARDPD